MWRALLPAPPVSRPFSTSARGYDATRALFLPPASLFRAGRLQEHGPGFPLASPSRGRGGPAPGAAALALKLRPIFGINARPWASSRNMLATDEMRRLARRGLARLAETLAGREMDKDATLATGVLTPSLRVVTANSPKPGQVVDGRGTPQPAQELVGDEARDRIARAFSAYSPLVRAGVETALNTRLLADERARERVYEDEFHERAPTGPAVSRAVEKAYALAGDIAELAIRAEAMGYCVTAMAPRGAAATVASPGKGRAGGGAAPPSPATRKAPALRDLKLSPLAAGMVTSVLEEGDWELPRPGSYGLPFKHTNGGSRGQALAGDRSALAGALSQDRKFLLRVARKAFMHNGAEVAPFSTRTHNPRLSRAVRVLRREKGLPLWGAVPGSEATEKR